MNSYVFVLMIIDSVGLFLFLFFGNALILCFAGMVECVAGHPHEC